MGAKKAGVLEGCAAGRTCRSAFFESGSWSEWWTPSAGQLHHRSGYFVNCLVRFLHALCESSRHAGQPSGHRRDPFQETNKRENRPISPSFQSSFSQDSHQPSYPKTRSPPKRVQYCEPIPNQVDVAQLLSRKPIPRPRSRHQTAQTLCG
ncbi:hypothetical protein BJX68DRAFT_191511 [Aspergillus pseudodeflectus]|uniref:Uncharacterized protein n=1 Tax=Aspergillus pseudodeflectus TaxID=176178 RepID=A0ABR4KXG9_9EURO